MGTRTAVRTCPLCEATCGLSLTLEDDTIVAVRGDEDDVFSAGYLCPKGATFGELDHDPDRLDTPLVRRDGELVEASWEEAFDEVATRLHALVQAHGPDAIGVYLGNPNVHNLAGQLYVRPLVKALRTRNVTSASSVDQQPKHLSCAWMFGDPFTIPVPDVDRTDLLVILGGNPRVSNGSLWTAPDLPGRLTDLRRRGGRLVVVDPARTRTAARADTHLAIRPGTDALLLAAIVTTVFAEDLARIPAHLVDHVEGLDLARASLRDFTPESVAARCGVSADAIRTLARDLAGTERACVYGRLGTTTQRFGTLTSWLVDLVNLVTGNLDVVGGAMLPAPAHHRRARTGFRTGRWASRVRGIGEVLGELPASVLAEEMTTPGEGRIRALFTVAGNPVLSTPDGEALDAAIAALDLVVCVDPYVTATSRQAHVVLPPPPARQRSHYDLAFTGFAVRNVANYSPPVVPLDEDRPDEWEILLTLAAIALGQRPPIDVETADAFVLGQLIDGLVADDTARLGTRDPDAILAALGDRRGPDRMLDLLLRAGPYGEGFGLDPDGISLARLEANPHGIDLGPLTPQFPARLSTETGRIVCANEPLLADVERLRTVLSAPGPADGELRLIGRRHLRTNNSWSHNVASLDRGRELCTLQMHPDDAASRGLRDGELAVVRNDTGEVTVPVEVTDDLRPGVVSLPHGFGHDLAGIRQQVATARPGVNSNRLSPTDAIDPLSGTAVLNGIAVEVATA
ncbi:MAG: molybdopterin-dependent oxidoreductase [Nitriliruptoraceae bacterium]|nr:molybdopterin-dependent oxidoreductase [Nitriliruptoraceae bacterium]